MATNYTNAQPVLYTTLDTAPDKFSVKTGSCSVVGNVVFGDGATTLFLTECVEGGYFFNGTDEVRQIKTISSNVLMYLDYAFTVNLPVFTPVRFVRGSRYQQVGCLAVGNGAIVNGVTLLGGTSVNFGGELDSVCTVDPLIIDGRVGSVLVTKGAQG